MPSTVTIYGELAEVNQGTSGRILLNSRIIRPGETIRAHRTLWSGSSFNFYEASVQMEEAAREQINHLESREQVWVVYKRLWTVVRMGESTRVPLLPSPPVRRATRFTNRFVDTTVDEAEYARGRSFTTLINEMMNAESLYGQAPRASCPDNPHNTNTHVSPDAVICDNVVHDNVRNDYIRTTTNPDPWLLADDSRREYVRLRPQEVSDDDRHGW